MADQARTGNEKADKSQKERGKHTRLYGWFETELRRQAHNRFQMALDEDYYDSEHLLW